MPQKRTLPTFLKENWLILATILYVFSPIDLIPDILPVVGGVDDSLLLIVQLLREYGKYRKEGKSKA